MAENHDEAISQFCAVTGAEHHVAEHYLSGFNWDVDRACNFFFEHPPALGGVAGSPGEGPGAQAADMTAEDERLAQQLMQEEEMRMQAPPVRMPAAPQIDLTGDDETPTGAPAAQYAPPGPQAHQPAFDVEDLDDNDEDEDAMLRTMAQHRQAGLAAAREASRVMDEMMASGRAMLGAHGLPTMFPGLDPDFLATMGAGRGAGAAGPLSVQGRGVGVRTRGGRGGGRVSFGGMNDGDEDDDEDPDAALARRLMREEEEAAGLAMAGAASHPPGAGRRSVGTGDDHGMGEDDLHEHLGMDKHDLEEARMMEAAMMGIPYEPRLPVRGAPSPGRPAGPPVAHDPEMFEHRSLRWEQDQAYEESLAADRAKAAAAERAEREAREAAQREAEAAAAAERAAAEEAARVAALRQQKAASLPAEPAAGTPGSMSIMIRLPDGSRLSRRFSTTNSLQALFDFVDAQEQNCGLKPGTYKLVNSYPRKVLSPDTEGTLESVGLTADTALFVEGA